MDKLTAYKILGLDESSGEREIKLAYARLSKEFHPEEHPEKFQEIREAYVFLTRKNKVIPTVSAPSPKKKTFENEPVHSNEKIAIEQIVIPEDVSPDSEGQVSDALDFEAQLQADQEKIQAFIKELTVLSTSKYRYNTNAFLSAFKKHGSDDILFSPEFMTELTVLLCNAKIDSLTTQHIYNLYQTREVPSGPEYQALMTVLQSHISADKTEHTMLYLLAMALLLAEIVIHSIWIDNFSVPFWGKTLYYLVYSCLNLGSIFYYQKRYPMVITEFKTCFFSLGFGVLSLFLPVWKIVLQDADAAKTFVLITLLINGIKLVIYFLLIFINPYFFEDLERPERKEEVSEELKRTELLLNDPTKVYSEDLENLTPKIDFNISKGRLFILTVFGWILVCAFSFLFEYIETGQLLLPHKSIILGAFCGVLLILLQQLLQIFTTLLDGTMYSVSIFLIIVIVIFANGYQSPLPLLGMISEYFIFYLFLISSFGGSILLFYLQYWKNKKKKQLNESIS